MSKEQKSNDGGQRHRQRAGNSGHSGRRFGKRREDYVDSFRWGFVEGSEDDFTDNDDELFSDAPESSEPKPARGEREDRNRRAKKTASRKPRPQAVERMEHDFVGDDDDDLKLPSYGRTPIPTDDELPTIPEKSPGRNRRKTRSNARVTPVLPDGDRDDGPDDAVARSDRPTARPRREQMVWDPEKREYVPLVIPEPAPRKTSRNKDRREKNATSQTVVKGEVVGSSDDKVTFQTPVSPVLRDKLEPRKRERRETKAVAVTRDADRPAPTGDSIKKKGERRPRPVPVAEKAEDVLPPQTPSRPSSQKPAKRSGGQERQERDEERKDGCSERPKKRPAAQKQAAQKPVAQNMVSVPQRGDVPLPPIKTRKPDPADVESEPTGFAKLGVSETMLDALRIVRYLEPTPIQAGVFQQVMAGNDIMGQAQTGTGKTAAFSIPIIEGVEECPPGNDPVALILVPTRELAVQVRDEAQRLCYGRDVRVTACYGGKPIAKQISRLREGVDVLVGTPGRILDLMNRSALSLNALRWVVLDEADRMLDIGFRPDIEKILKRTPTERQTLLFSATLPAPVVRLAEKYMKSPEVLDFSNKGVAVDTIEQYYVTVDPERKFDALLFLLEEQQPNQAIIFTRTKRGADRLARSLSKRMDNLAAIHGDLGQGDRDRVMANFRSGKLRYLVATDVVGRGIDVSGISHIINYDIPAFCDDYVHRVGRTGRMGREGVAYTFVTVEEGSELTRIEMRIDKLLKRADLKGFESFTKPSDPNANIDDLTLDAPSADAKPVYGKSVRKVRRAL